MYCKYCANELSDDAKYCPKCGKLVAQPEKEEVDFFGDIEVTTVNKENNEAKNSFENKILTFSILGLAFAFTGALSLLGLIFSYIAKGMLRKFTGEYGETKGRTTVAKGLSTAGVAIGWVMMVCFIIYVVAIVLSVLGYIDMGVVESFPFSDYYFYY